MNIIQMRNSNAFLGRDGLKPRWVILHGTAGGTSAQAIASYFQSTQGSDNPVSAHYVIGQDGQIVQCNDEGDGAWANGVVTTGHDPWWNVDGNPNPNNVTISIEHVKPDDANATDLTPAQKAASFALIADICQRNGIPMRWADSSGGITGHYSMDPVNRARCPGTYPWSDLYNYLKGNTNMNNVPTGWSDNATSKILTAPNGISVILGFRDHILADPNWDPANWPLEPEQHLDLLEQSNTSLGGGQAQMFRWKRLEYTEKMGVFEGWLGQELLWYQKQYAAMTAEIAQLKALLASSNIGQIGTIGKQISDDIALIMKLVQVQ